VLLHITEDTVKATLRIAFAQLGAANRAQAVADSDRQRDGLTAWSAAAGPPRRGAGGGGRTPCRLGRRHSHPGAALGPRLGAKGRPGPIRSVSGPHGRSQASSPRGTGRQARDDGQR
jgi:hypothetical protein